MCFCGFNQKMLEGIGNFNEGLVEHGILDRSEKKKQTAEQTINRELEDMSCFLKEVHNLTDPNIRELTETLARYACAYYKFIQKNGVSNYPKLIKFLNKFYFEMDRKYYSELEGEKDAMKKLVEHLNKIKLEGGG